MTDTLDAATRLCRTDSWLGTLHDGEVIMMEATSGRFLGLNESASRVWTLLETPMTLGGVGEALARDYVVDQEQAVSDIQPFVCEMLASGVLSIA